MLENCFLIVFRRASAQLHHEREHWVKYVIFNKEFFLLPFLTQSHVSSMICLRERVEKKVVKIFLVSMSLSVSYQQNVSEKFVDVKWEGMTRHTSVDLLLLAKHKQIVVDVKRDNKSSLSQTREWVSWLSTSSSDFFFPSGTTKWRLTELPTFSSRSIGYDKTSLVLCCWDIPREWEKGERTMIWWSSRVFTVTLIEHTSDEKSLPSLLFRWLLWHSLDLKKTWIK